jgi:hypothetical protein
VQVTAIMFGVKDLAYFRDPDGYLWKVASAS